jgi:hypothetical protein
MGVDRQPPADFDCAVGVGGPVEVASCVMLVHHAYVDGVGASWLMQRFYQPHPGIKAGDPPAYNPAPLPSWLTRLGWAFA